MNIYNKKKIRVSITSLPVLNTARINGRNPNKGYSVFTNMHSITCWSVLHSNILFTLFIKSCFGSSSYASLINHGCWYSHWFPTKKHWGISGHILFISIQRIFFCWYLFVKVLFEILINGSLKAILNFF